MRVSALVLCLGVMSSLEVLAEVVADPDEEDLPDLELLEFIVEWRADGEAIDPASFAGPDRGPAGRENGEVDDETR